MENKPHLLAVAHVGAIKSAPSGGALRTGRALKEYSKHFNICLVLPPTRAHINSSFLSNLRNELNLYDIIVLDTPLKPVLTRSSLNFIYPLMPRRLLNLMLKGFERSNLRPTVIGVLNEPLEYLVIGSMLKNKFESPAYALLQLPIFYRERRRRENIFKALRLWCEELYRGEYLNKLIRVYGARFRLTIEHSEPIRAILRSYDTLIAVSRAVPYEMGTDWIRKFFVLDPGVSLDEEDLEIICRIKQQAVKQEYVVFGGRVEALKGFVEGLYVFRELVKHNPSLRLIVTGYVDLKLKARIEILIRRLGLDGKVILTGSLPRSERFRVVANAKLMIYPSHIDSFSYAALESLYLGTPVVAYDIPALRIYYGNNPGVRLVEEGNTEALTTEAFNLLESKNIDIEQPKLRRWEDILKEELMLINKLIDRG